MFSGKTTELLRRMRVMSIAEKNCVLIRPCTDTRAPRCHTGEEHPGGCIVVKSLVGEAGREQRVRDADVIAIDEAQFFEPDDLREFSCRYASRGCEVMMAMLDGDFKQRPFPAFSEMVPVCDHTMKLSAVCMKCKALEAPFSVRIGECTNAVVEIGGAEKYQAVCRKCLN